MWPFFFDCVSLVTSTHLQQPKDWFSITREDLACSVLRRIPKTNLGPLLEERYPHLDWSKIHLTHGRFGQQRHLERVVAALFEVLCVCFLFSPFITLVLMG